KYLYPLVTGIGDINLVGCCINGDGSRVIELSIARAFAAPTRKHVSIRTELNDSRVSLIDDIDRVIRTDSDSARSVESQSRAFPLGDECPVRRQFLHAVIGPDFCHVNIASTLDGDSVWLS